MSQQHPKQRVASAKSPARPRPRDQKTRSKQHQAPQSEPEWNSQKALPAPPSAATSTPDKAEMLLQELASSLSHSEQPLDSRVQNVLAKIALKPSDPSQQMQSANSRLKNARENLQKAKEARQNLHRNWRAFLNDAVKRWEAHSNKFTAEDKELLEAIGVATASFHEAKDYFQASREVLEAHDSKETIQEISDDELLSESAPSVNEDIAMMLTSLSKIRDRQEEAQEEGTAAKKPRTVNLADAGDRALDSGVPSALTPFGSGGK